MKNLRLAIFVAGFCALVGQALIIREGLAFFSGNELVSGIVLCLWLLWTGVGSFLFSKVKVWIAPQKFYGFLVFLFCICLVFSLLFFRIAPKVFGLPFGEVISVEKIVLISLLALAPVCLIAGALFPAASMMIPAQSVYLIESIGSFAGGILFSFVLVSLVPPFGVLLIVCTFLLFAGFLCVGKKTLSILCFVLLILLFRINSVEFFFRQIQMPGQRLIGLYESKYGTIALTKSESQINFYTSGFFDFSYPDIYSTEEAVHYPLLIHPEPENVLLISGGLGGGIEQALKHKVIQKLVYVELDPEIVRISSPHTKLSAEEKRLDIVLSDGRYYVKNTDAMFDCIIVNSPDPINAQLNRCYTKEFFQEAKARLNADGLFCIRVNAPADILSPVYSQFLGTIYRTLNQVFKHIYILPAAKATYIATDKEIQEKIPAILSRNLKLRGLELNYVNSSYFEHNLSEQRMRYYSEQISRAHSYVNLDLKPVCYYFGSVLWGGIVSVQLKSILMKLFNVHPVVFFLPLIVLLFFYRRKSIIQLSVFSVGATSISVEIILLIIFQVFHGYIYAWIGIITGFFMLGLACGTLFFIRFLNKKILNAISAYRVIIKIQVSVMLYCVILLLLSLVRAYDSQFLIAILLFMAGFLGGVHFPLSVKITGEKKAGQIYGIDLFGACAGVIVTSLVLIPILGISNCILLFVVLNLLVSVGLVVLKNKMYFAGQ